MGERIVLRYFIWSLWE